MKLGLGVKWSKEQLKVNNLKGEGRLGREWLKLPVSSSPSSPSFSLRVMSYNILAPCYVFPKFFPFNSKEHLDWKHRSPKIIQYKYSNISKRNILPQVPTPYFLSRIPESIFHKHSLSFSYLYSFI